MQFDTPILFLIFNRPVQTQRVFEMIRTIKPSKLYVAADGPRLGNREDEENCEKVRNMVTGAVDWPCEIKTLFRERNLGCGPAVSSAITWFFEAEEAGIILEDDCLPDKTFFSFCETLLEKYKHNEKIMMISGFSFHKSSHAKVSYYFSRLASIWGWATWRRSWRHYRYSIASTTDFGNTFSSIENDVVRKAFADMLMATYQGRIDTWDIQWTLTIEQRQGICIVPVTNLVRNIGYSGAHSRKKISASQQILAESMDVDSLVHPDDVAVDKDLERLFQKAIASVMQDQPILTRFKNSLRSAARPPFLFVKQKRDALKLAVKNYLSRRGLKLEPLRMKRIFLQNVFRSGFKKNVLISHTTQPFRTGVHYKHTAGMECLQIARIFHEAGYSIDVVDYDEPLKFTDIDYGKYDIVFGQGIAFENSFYAQRKAQTICYVTGNHPHFLNASALKRLSDFYERHQKLSVHSALFNHQLYPLQFGFSDYLIVWGNDFTVSTITPYHFRKKETVFTIPAFYHKVMDPDLPSKNYEQVSRNFLWFGSSRFIHRGLDLVIDIFRERKELTLHICGPVTYETDFFKLYESTISACPNIVIHGFVDIGKPQFRKIMDQCAFLIYPSISDAGAASVLTAVGNGGLLPVISRNCGLDFDPFAIFIEEVNERSIKTAIDAAVKLPEEELKIRSRQAYDYVSRQHSLENFHREMKKTIESIIK
jgi:glycosyltransferase involved in cell wall biosynthesis